MGADAIVIEGTEAGGHIGPVATSVLAQEILPVVRDVPVFVAGGIGRGEAIVSYLEMGASGVQLGTRFVCASECVAHPNFKKAFFKANARDAMPSVQVDPQFPGDPGARPGQSRPPGASSNIQHEVIDRFRSGEMDQKAAQLEIEHFWAGALRKAVIDGDVENGSVMAGQSVGMVTQGAADRRDHRRTGRPGGGGACDERSAGPGSGRSDAGRAPAPSRDVCWVACAM